MTVYKIIYSSIANSPDGNEPADTIWFAGCSIRCLGCVNQGLWDRSAGREMTVKKICDGLFKSLSPWVSLSGGEPTEQAEFPELIKALSERKKVLLNTGKDIGDIISMGIATFLSALKYGPFIESKKGGFGSENQVMLVRRKSGIFERVAFKERKEFILSGREVIETGYG